MEEMFDVLNEWGEYTGEVASRDRCHTEGLWHRAVYGFVIDKNKNVLTVGGHVDAGEFGRQALIREAKEELGLDITDDDIKYLVGSTSIDTAKGINKHYNECYLILKDVDISEIKLQKEEVSEVRYFSKKEILERIDNNLDGLTIKTGPWTFLKKLLEK